MPRTTVTAMPSLRRRLAQLGENIHLARLRRRLSASQVAERAGITRTTLRSIEHGDGSVSLGAYANVLFCLGLDQDLDPIARDDELGRKLQDANLTVKRRASRRSHVNRGAEDGSIL
ncbi:MAG TPA: helix-turn-helix transcriptional regulator [Chthonomonadaceae bacterium]|nr:helix-turn-helix transcriptional regulator [Chthonomonadaceae bacterium]